MKTYFSQIQNPFGKAARKLAFFGGVNLIILSVAIFLFPEILAYTVAAILMLGGISLLGLGLKIKSRSGHRQNFHQQGETIYYTR